MTHDEAKAIAKKHLEAKPLDDPYERTVPEGRFAIEGWYFDYTFKIVGQAPANDDDMDRAHGYLVRDSGEVEDLGREDYELLRFEPKLGL